MNFNKGKKNLDLFYIHNKPECISFHCFSVLIKTESHFSQPYRMQMTPCRGSLRPTIALWQTYTRGCVALVCCYRLRDRYMNQEVQLEALSDPKTLQSSLYLFWAELQLGIYTAPSMSTRYTCYKIFLFV